MFKRISGYYKRLNNFNKIFLFFIIIMLLLIIPTVIVSTYTSKIIINKQTEANRNYVSYISKDADDIFINARNSCYNIMGTEQYDNYIKYFKKYDKNFTIYSIKLNNNIKNIINNNPYIKNILIYSYDPSVNDGFIMSADGTYDDSRVYFDRINAKSIYDSGFWNDIFKERFSIKILPSSMIANGYRTGKSNVITMIVKKHYSDAPTSNTYMIVDLNEKALFNYMKDSNITKNAHVYILDKQTGEFLNSSDELNIKSSSNNKLIADAISEGKTDIDINLNNKSYLMSYQKSAINDMYYIVFTLKSVITTDVRNFMYISLFVIFSFSIIAFITSLFFTEKIYSPLGDTIKYIKWLTGDVGQNENEYEYLKGSFFKMKELQKNYLFNAKYMLIYRAINGNLSLDEARELMKQNKTFLNKKYFAIMSIRINPPKNSKNIDISTIKEMFSPFGEFIELRPGIYINFMNIDSPEELDANLDKMEETVSGYIRSNPGVNIYMSISDLFDDIMSSSNFYQQSINILDMRSINLNKLIYSQDDTGSDELYTYSKTELGYLSKYVSNANETDALILINKIFKFCKDKNMTFIRFRQVADELLMIAFDVIEQKKIDYRCIFDNLKELLQNINAIQNPADIEQKCIDLYKQVFGYLKTIQNNSNTIDDIFRYIDQNICTTSLNDVAYKFKMNPNYLSQYFKKHTGETFTDYLNNKKLAIAKDKLMSNDKTVEEISQELGFSNSSAFIRMFKKIEGITPNSYRSKMDKVV